MSQSRQLWYEEQVEDRVSDTALTYEPESRAIFAWVHFMSKSLKSAQLLTLSSCQTQSHVPRWRRLLSAGSYMSRHLCETDPMTDPVTELHKFSTSLNSVSLSGFNTVESSDLLAVSEWKPANCLMVFVKGCLWRACPYGCWLKGDCLGGPVWMFLEKCILG